MMCDMSEPAVPRQSIPPWTIGWRLKRSLNFADISAQEMADALIANISVDIERPETANLHGTV